MGRFLKAVGGLLSVAALGSFVGPGAGATTTAAACPDANLVPAHDNLPRVEAAVLCLVNRERSSARLATLKRAPQLDRSAAWHDTEMRQHHFLSETAPGRTTLIERIRAFGYFTGVKNAIYSENVGAGPTTNGTAQALMDAWMASPPHRANIMFANFRDIGVAAVPAPADPAFFANYPSTVYTTDFGRRLASRPRCVVRKHKHSSSRQAAPRRRYCRKR